jgi:hypothetical protein
VTAVVPDAVLGGRYRLDSRIAGGGMGQVWRGTDLLLGRPVAVKLLREEYSDSEEFRARLHAEAKAAAVLTHPNVATVFDYGETTTPGDRCRSYLVMQLVDARSLSEVAGEPPDPRWPADRVVNLLRQAADALAAAHRAGLVHRDIKPANLLVGPDDRLTITDFGIARAAGAMPLTVTGATIGTPDYMAPEQAAGEPVGPAADLYSLGLVGYELLAGRRPFAGDTGVARAAARLARDPAPLPDDVPAPVQQLIADLLSRQPADRPDDVALGRRLREVAGAAAAAPSTAPTAAGTAPMPVLTPPNRPTGPFTGRAGLAEAFRRGYRSRWAWPAAAAVLLLIIIVAVASTGTGRAADTLVRVPNVVGARLAAARHTLAHDGFTIHVRKINSRRPAGTVIKEQPAARARLARHGVVTLTVADGFVRVPRHGLLGVPFTTAANRLAAHGLHASESFAYNSNPAGTVVKVGRHGRVRLGSTIPLTVSKGPLIIRTVPTNPGPPSHGHHHGPPGDGGPGNGHDPGGGQGPGNGGGPGGG